MMFFSFKNFESRFLEIQKYLTRNHSEGIADWLKLLSTANESLIIISIYSFLFSVFLTVGYHLLFQLIELVHLPYIAVASNTRKPKGPEGEEPFLITTPILFLNYIRILSTNPMFLFSNSLSLVNTLSCKYYSISSHIVVCLFITTTSVL